MKIFFFLTLINYYFSFEEAWEENDDNSDKHQYDDLLKEFNEKGFINYTEENISLINKFDNNNKFPFVFFIVTNSKDKKFEILKEKIKSLKNKIKEEFENYINPDDTVPSEILFIFLNYDEKPDNIFLPVVNMFPSIIIACRQKYCNNKICLKNRNYKFIYQRVLTLPFSFEKILKEILNIFLEHNHVKK